MKDLGNKDYREVFLRGGGGVGEGGMGNVEKQEEVKIYLVSRM